MEEHKRGPRACLDDMDAAPGADLDVPTLCRRPTEHPLTSGTDLFRMRRLRRPCSPAGREAQLATAQRATPGTSYPPSVTKRANASSSRALIASRSPSASPRSTIAIGPAMSVVRLR